MGIGHQVQFLINFSDFKRGSSPKGRPVREPLQYLIISEKGEIWIKRDRAGKIFT